MANVEGSRGSARAVDVLGPQWRRQVTELRRWESEVRLDLPDSVHRFRVTARRLRSNLRGFGALLDGEAGADLSADLRRAAAVVGTARDAETLRQRIDDLLRDEPDQPGLLSTRNRLVGHLEQTYRSSWQEAVEHLETDEYDSFIRRLEGFCDLPPWSAEARLPADVVLRPLLRTEWHRFRAKGRSALAVGPGPAGDVALHDARKAAKRARYLCEALTPLFGRKCKRLAKAAEDVQVVLGEHQDCVLTQRFLGSAGAQAYRYGEYAFVLGRLQAREADTAAQLRDDYVGVFHAADRKSLRRWLARSRSS